jgi:hypothetical protein
MGRPLGSKNRYNEEARRAVEEAFEAMNGAQGLTEWAMDNPTLFYLHIWTKLLPRAVNIDATVQQQDTVVLNAVNVADVSEAINVLEHMRLKELCDTDIYTSEENMPKSLNE